MLKRDELSKPASCLNKAAPDEPLFVLRAKDPMAPMAVRHWATMSDGKHEPDKVQDALALADKMDAWRNSGTVTKAPENDRPGGPPPPKTRRDYA